MKLKAGLEIHQQLDCGKLFCKCESEDSEKNISFQRKLHATSSEMGDIDVAAQAEGIREFTYYNKSCRCLVYTDEEPPRGPNPKAVEIALEFAKLAGAELLEEINFMRKIVVDGSNTSGFQRTGLIAMGGQIEYEGGTLDIDQICLEEDSCRRGKNKDEYLIDRLGIPLLEVTTKPQLKEPIQVKQAARALGRLLRACRVKRGLGTIRQDVNVSINDGNRVELKGFQDLSTMDQVVEKEIERQKKLNTLVKGKTSEPIDVSQIFKGKRKFAFACKIENWNGVLGNKESKVGHLRMGRELADHAKKAGLKGIMHSDELPAYGVNNDETKEINSKLKCEIKDSFILMFGKELDVRNAMEKIIERIKNSGVQKEVRRVTPEGQTRYLRPMPGASRMYPETDIPPMNLTKISINKPKTLDQREKELPLNEEESKQIVSRNLDYKFNELLKECKEPQVLSRIILHVIPNLDSSKIQITDEDITHVTKLVSDGKIAKEGIEEALIKTSKGEEITLNTKDVEADVISFIDSLIQQRKDFVKEKGMEAVGPLMGPVMGKFRGKMDGKKINSLLMERIKDVL
ncbi:MAG: Glu-tRNA(Gln) amidotransferase subunit GatE [Candidatus Poseidoniales archaeon]